MSHNHNPERMRGRQMLMNALKSRLALVKSLLGLIRPRRGLILLFLLLSFLTAVTEGMGVSLIIPLLEAEQSHSSFTTVPVLGHVASLFDGMDKSEKFRAVAVILGVVLIFRGVLIFSVGVLSGLIPMRLAKEYSTYNFDALTATKMSFITGMKIGDLRNGVFDLPQRVAALLLNMSHLFSQGLIVVVYICLMMMMSWKLTLVALVFLAVSSNRIKAMVHRPLKSTGVSLTHEQATYGTFLHEAFSGMRTIRFSGAELLINRLHEAARDRFYRIMRRQLLLSSVSGPLTITTAGLFIAVVLFFAASMHDPTDTGWVATLILFVFLLSRIAGPVSLINASQTQVLGELHAVESLLSFVERTRQERQPDGSEIAPVNPARIEARNLSFAYPGSAGVALKNVSFEVRRGQMVAVVGPSGAGKSSLVALLARLYDPDEGAILVDGRDLRDFQVQSWRQRLGIVSQDVFLFDDTIRSNICFGHGSVSDSDLRRVAEDAAALEFIEQLSDGFETMIGDRGIRLSGGQQQRIALARALIAEPSILVLDEATSHLDSLTEKAVQESIRRMRHRQTLFIIAHRLSTVQLADVILVMDDGRIIESGTHAELVQRGGFYKRMLETQGWESESGTVTQALAPPARP